MTTDPEGQRVQALDHRFWRYWLHDHTNIISVLSSGIKLIEMEGVLSSSPESNQYLKLIKKHLRISEEMLRSARDYQRLLHRGDTLRVGPHVLQHTLCILKERLGPFLEAKGLSLTLDMPDQALLLEADRDYFIRTLAFMIMLGAEYPSGRHCLYLSVKAEGNDLVCSLLGQSLKVVDPQILTASIDEKDHYIAHLMELIDVFLESQGGKVSKSVLKELGEKIVVDIRFPLNGKVVLAHPRSRAKGTAREYLTEESIGTGVENRKILIIEDSEDQAKMLEVVLSNYGAEVQLASSAERALVLLKSFIPEIILCDLNLPGMHGKQFVKIIRNKIQNEIIGIVAMTGNDGADIREQSFLMGFDSHLPKPLVPGEVVKTIEKVVQFRQLFIPNQSAASS